MAMASTDFLNLGDGIIGLTMAKSRTAFQMGRGGDVCGHGLGRTEDSFS
jgi:hypothetical protein